MMPNKPSKDDAELKRVLGEWKVTANLPPRFQGQVWNRIARSGAAVKPSFGSLWLDWLDWFETTVPRPAVSGAYLTVMLIAGVAAGYWHGSEKASQVRESLGSRYVQSVDPYQALMARK